jgi:hypothetical protein
MRPVGIHPEAGTKLTCHMHCCDMSTEANEMQVVLSLERWRDGFPRRWSRSDGLILEADDDDYE